MEKYIKYLSYGVVFLIGVMLAWSLYAKVASATEVPPKCWEEVEEPTCEELQNCEPEAPVEVPVEVPKVSQPDAPKKFGVSQGPHGVKGDGYCQLEYKTIKGSKKIEVRYAEDGVFGNGYKSFTTEDDGAIDLKSDSGKVKYRGRDSKTEWSEARSYSC